MNFKRILSLILSICMMLTITTFPVMAASVTSDGLSYYSVGNNITINGYSGSSTDVVIPSKIGGKTVTVISDYAFEHCANITSIVIPNGVTTIGESAFSNCRNLKNITIPSSVNKIADGAFSMCTSLKSITLPNNVETIGVQMFNGCSSLKTITLGSGVTTIKEYAFFGCSNLTSIVIPDGVTTISTRMFEDCVSLTSISIPSSIIKVEEFAFKDCTSLADVYYSGTMSNLGMMEIGTGNTTFMAARWHYTLCEDNGHTYDNDDDKECNICRKSREFSYRVEDGTAIITDYIGTATDVVVPSKIDGYNVTAIDAAAFLVTMPIVSVSIPKSIISIADDAFFACSSLVSINVDKNNTNYTSENGILFNYDKTTLIQYPAGKTNTTYVVPQNITSIGAYAFNYCKTLSTIVMPNDVTSIGKYAFKNCESLTDAYYQGVNFNWVTVGEGNDCLTNATIHHHNMEGGMGGIGWDMHEMDNGYTDACDDECNVCKYRREAPHTYDGDADLICDGCGNVRQAPVATFNYTVENGEVTITEYTGNATEVAIPSTIEGYPVTKIGDNAFGENRNIVSVIVPGSVKTIGNYAFYFCTSLKTVMINEGVVSIGEDAFGECSNLTSIGLPESLVSLGDYAFEYCSKLVFVNLPRSLTEIGDYAFNGCYNINTVFYNGSEAQKQAIEIGDYNDSLINAAWQYAINEAPATDFEYTIENGEVTITKYTGNATEVNIPSTIEDYPVTVIGHHAFFYCTSLTDITIPDSVTSIGNGAFVACRSLTSVTIPDSVTSIGTQAFYVCDSLTSVAIPSSVTFIGTGAFSECGSLTEINVDANNPYHSSVDGVLFIKDKTGLIQYPTGKTATIYTIPDSVTTIGNNAFSGCSSLTSIAIPNSVTEIGDYAFNGCTSLKGDVQTSTWSTRSGSTVVLTIPDSVTTIGEYAFGECSSLTSVTIGDGVETIGDGAFGDCESLETVTLGTSVETIGNSAFSNCTALATVNIPKSVTEIGSQVFAGCESLTAVNYEGTATDKENITFGDDNDNLLDNWKDEPAYVPGDVNSDGDVNNKDLGILRRFLNDWDVTIDELASDVNRDGEVNNKDLGLLRRYLNDWDVELK